MILQVEAIDDVFVKGTVKTHLFSQSLVKSCTGKKVLKIIIRGLNKIGRMKEGGKKST